MSADDGFETQPKYGSDDWIDDFGIPREKRFSRPKLPHPETGEVQPWTRTSTIAKVLDDTYNLELWKQRMVAKGVASRRDLTNRAATTDMADRAAWIEICDMASGARGWLRGTQQRHVVARARGNVQRGPDGASIRSRYPEELLDDLWAYVARAQGVRHHRWLPNWPSGPRSTRQPGSPAPGTAWPTANHGHCPASLTSRPRRPSTTAKRRSPSKSPATRTAR